MEVICEFYKICGDNQCLHSTSHNDDDYHNCKSNCKVVNKTAICKPTRKFKLEKIEKLNESNLREI